MKRYFYMILAFLAVTTVSCSTDSVDVDPSSLTIEVEPSWDATRGITSASQTVTAYVKLNVQTINWQVSSDSEWLKVDSGEVHTGSDELEMVVDANDDFDKRNAVLTITAGLYTQRLEVDQAGNVFIMSDIYRIVSADESVSFDVEVRTLSLIHI